VSDKHTGRTVRYSRGDVPAGATDWERLRALTDEEVEALAASDADNPPLTDAQLAGGELVAPSDRAKVPVYIRLDAEVVEHFKAGGAGYQTRINEALRRVVREARRREADGGRRVVVRRLRSRGGRWEPRTPE
jgi:uncharacterized protein (DUF4415 family)